MSWEGDDDWENDAGEQTTTSTASAPAGAAAAKPRASWDDEEAWDSKAVKEDWEADSDDEKKKAAAAAAAAAPAAKPAKGKAGKKAAAVTKNATPFENFADPEERRNALKGMEEEGDMRLTEDMFGGDANAHVVRLELVKCTTAREFDEFAQRLSAKITEFQRSPHYVDFLTKLLRNATVSLDTDKMQKVTTACNAIQNEKIQAEREKTKGKKKASAAPKKQTIKVGDPLGMDDDEFDGGAGDYDAAYDDFM